ncbi:MAG: hypothetical protein ACK4Q5_02350 [Saprospiraceae bacterium]
MVALTDRFNNAQLEIMQLFAADDLREPELRALKKILLRFKAERLMDEADKIWDEKGWTNEDVKRLLQVKMRTPYKRRSQSS